MSEPSLRGKVALVTGANTGIGRVTARELAKQGAHVFLACRSEDKTGPALAEIAQAAPAAKAEYLPLDLGNFDSVRRCADAFLRRDMPLHLLVNNGGLAGGRGRSKSGFEVHFGVNHMGHFLLTTLLLPRLEQSAPARIVTVSSEAHRRPRGIDFEAVRRPTATRRGFIEYGTSKLANVLFSAELARRVDRSRITTYSLHPGVAATDVWRRVPAPLRFLIKLFMISPEDGAKTTLHCATSLAAAKETALYYDKCQVKWPSRVAQDAALARRLWEYSEAQIA
jgi:NAD(P)-dependent dehydrogenase (short-subunit alcohol dehydrogenase family)